MRAKFKFSPRDNKLSHFQDEVGFAAVRRVRRFVFPACTNVVECLGTFTLILPLRYTFDVELIYDRLTGERDRESAMLQFFKDILS